MSLRDVTPVSALRFRLTGLVRAREDTIRSAHSAGASVFIISASALIFLRKGYFSDGSTHSFEFQPSVAGVPVDFSTLVPLSPYTITARSKRPLPPLNVIALAVICGLPLATFGPLVMFSCRGVAPEPIRKVPSV